MAIRRVQAGGREIEIIYRVRKAPRKIHFEASKVAEQINLGNHEQAEKMLAAGGRFTAASHAVHMAIGSVQREYDAIGANGKPN